MKKVIIFILTYCLFVGFTFASAVRLLYQPFISIIISAYNYEKYVGTTIESVLTSTCQDFEIIIVNDGSTDNTLKEIQKYARNNSKITIIDQENQGLSLARNNAFKIANGQYVWFVDADDFIDKSAIEKMKNAVTETQNKTDITPDIVSFHIEPVNQNGLRYTDRPGYYSLLPRELTPHRVHPFKSRQLPHHVIPYYPATSSKQIYRSAYLKDKKILFIPRLVFEDEVFFASALAADANGIIIPEALYYKRGHGASITHNRPKYYDSTVRLPQITYSEVKRVGGSEDMARFYFNWHFNGVFGKWPNQQKFIPVLKELLTFIQQQEQDEFWQTNEKRLRLFIQEKEEKITIQKNELIR